VHVLPGRPAFNTQQALGIAHAGAHADTFSGEMLDRGSECACTWAPGPVPLLLLTHHADGPQQRHQHRQEGGGQQLVGVFLRDGLQREPRQAGLTHHGQDDNQPLIHAALPAGRGPCPGAALS
jgi:hypothetical protein